jgi:hypothetical protein
MRKGTETSMKKKKRERGLKIERNEMGGNEKVQYNLYERSRNLQLSLHATHLTASPEGLKVSLLFPIYYTDIYSFRS